MYLLVLLLTLSPALGLSLAASRSEFRSGASSSTKIHVVPRSFSFRMNYRNGNDEDQGMINAASLSSSTTGRLPKTVVHASSPSSAALGNDEDTSKKVDEYLEFLDKRYNRMRDTNGPQEKKKPFSVLKWLGQENHMEPPSEETDALYALGVAGLASERLLQKHGVSRVIVQPTAAATSMNDDSIVVECDSSTESSMEERMSLLLNKIFAVFAAKLVALQRQVAAKRNLMLQALALKSKKAGKAALAFLPRATSDFVRAAVKAGGGERNLKIAATAMCAFAIYFAQPLIKGAIARTQV